MIKLNRKTFDDWLKKAQFRLLTTSVIDNDCINYMYVEYNIKSEEFIVFFNKQVTYRGKSFEAANKVFQMNQGGTSK